MKIQIQQLEENKLDDVDLKDVGPVYPSDDVIYFNGTPYKLSTAKAKPQPCKCHEFMGDNKDCTVHEYLGDPS